MLRFLTAGESHGKALVGIIEGIPANLSIDIDEINKELKRRQGGYGRGDRMKIEKDTVTILSGIRLGKTTGSPIAIMIENRDWVNWKDIMTELHKEIDDSLIVTRPRPGHGDLAGALKYNQKDIRNILERASARETAARVAIGSIAKQLIRQLDIEVYSYVTQIGKIRVSNTNIDISKIKFADKSPVRVLCKQSEEKIIKEIDKARQNGDSLGGRFEVICVNVPIGLGSHVHWDRKIDGKIAQAIMSIQGIKGVEIGLGFDYAGKLGSEVHDEIYYEDEYIRKTNNAGGIEAGISNGSNIIVGAVMKPIPTLSKPLNSVDMISKEPFKALKERSDVCAVPSASVVGESVLAWVIANEIINKFGGDSMGELIKNYKNYLKYIISR